MDILETVGKFFRAMMGKTGDTTFQVPRIDVSTHSLQTIEYEHHEIHAGSMFTCHFNNDVTNIGEQTGIAFRTPANKEIHVIVRYESTTAAYASIYEDSDLDSGEGTDLAVYNHDRNSANTSLVRSIESPAEVGKATSWNEAQLTGATLSTATELSRHYIGATTINSEPGGGGRGEAEFILKKDTEYCFVLTSLSSDDGAHNITLHWYEHTKRTA